MLYKMTKVDFDGDLCGGVDENSIREREIYIDVNKIETLSPRSYPIRYSDRFLSLTIVVMGSGEKHMVKENPEEIIQRMLNQNVW